MNETINSHLIKLARENNGTLTPEMVVSDAKNSKSPLHGMFEWDIRKAAQKHWLATARDIIARVRYVEETTEHSIASIAFVRDPRVPPGEQGYVETRSIRGEKDAAKQVVISEFNRAVACMERAREVAQVLGHGALIERLIRQLTQSKDKVAA